MVDPATINHLVDLAIINHLVDPATINHLVDGIKINQLGGERNLATRALLALVCVRAPPPVLPIDGSDHLLADVVLHGSLPPRPTQSCLP